MSNRFFVLAFVVIFISCSKVGPGEHGHLAFENNSSDTVYVENFFDDGHVYMDYHFGVSEEYCGIAPGSVNYETLSIYSSGMCYSYEYVFSKKKTYDKIYVFVVPFYPKESCPPKPLFSYRLVCTAYVVSCPQWIVHTLNILVSKAKMIREKTLETECSWNA